MGWARLDDGFHDHPKLLGLPLDAVGLYVLSLTWAHRHKGASFGVLGYVPPDLPARFGGNKGAKLAAVLERARLWDAEPNLGGWVIHDFEDYLPAADKPTTANDVRRARSDAGRNGARSRWADKSKATAGQPDGKLLSDGDSKSMPPSRPVPTQPKEPTTRDSLSHDFQAFWQAYPRTADKPAALKAWAKATLRAPPDIIIAAAVRYRNDPNRDQQYTKNPATWLNADAWENPPEPERHINGHRPSTTDSRVAEGIALTRLLQQQESEQATAQQREIAQ